DQTRRDRPEEEQLVLSGRTANGPTELVANVLLLLVLYVSDGLIVRRVQHETLDGPGAHRAAVEEPVPFAVERVAAGLGDRADHAAQCAAVFSLDARGFHLDFLQVL